MDLCRNLITWVGTFKGLEAAHATAEELSDGVAMAEVLSQIAPEWFDLDWTSKLKRNIQDNRRLKLSNLKKVLKGIEDYYSEVLNQDLSGFEQPDVVKIAEDCSAADLGKMLQLILGCAVNCEEKDQYIQMIMGLEESVQHAVMNAIQEIMEIRETSRLSESDLMNEYPPQQDPMAKILNEKESLAQNLHNANEAVRMLKEEKAVLQSENEHLRKLKDGQGSEGDKRNFSNAMLERLQHQLDQLKEDNFTLETAKEDARLRLEHEEKENMALKEKVEQLSALAEEARELKDEIDVFRHSEDKVARYESTIASYKKKLEEMGDLKRQVKSLEEKNSMYMTQTFSMEEDLKKASTTKAQMEMYKKQVHELQSKYAEIERKFDKAEYEAKRSKEKQQNLQTENERLCQERDTLKETIDELSLAEAQKDVPSPAADIGASPPGHLGTDFIHLTTSLAPEIKEKIIRLQHDNKVLKLQCQAAANEQTQVLQTQLEDANSRINELETDSRQLRQRILELEGSLEDTQASDMDKLQDASVELKEKKKQIELLKTNTSSSAGEIEALRKELSEKDNAMKEMEERYKKYLEKAKSVIQTLDPKQGVNPDIQLLRQQLQEKEKLIGHLERDHEQIKARKEREEKLIVTAWYELGMQLHRKAAEERMSTQSGLSFLSRQRQAASMRRFGSTTGSPSSR